MIIGHQLILKTFKRLHSQNSLAHAYLFVGPAQVGKATVALKIAEIIQGVENDNQDMLVISSQPREAEGGKEAGVTIKQIRSMQHFLSLSVFQAKFKVVIIDGIDTLNRDATTSLLKTLEEPPPNSIIICISSHYEKILPTITSRCQVIRFGLVKESFIEIFVSNNSPRLAKRLSRLASGRPGVAINFLINTKLIKDYELILKKLIEIEDAEIYEKLLFAKKISENYVKFQEMLTYWQLLLRDKMLAQIGCGDLSINEVMKKNGKYDIIKLSELLRNAQELVTGMQNPSFNLRLALENFLLQL
ncbi:MAG: hypothetical protein COU81_01040 [Candidatus Portnoybacteria bacterium CG10_big_fil_rev_8_21_14_0_10_36_7]|uniref:AAA+ ATPase domain-containing protein n=1 Tax=Candidatus Portnoybacteria bacterium CG10_big_fil_rev_8_21_14_0_10_36_7 TaxID=1974812 RepID=A0A2M8KEP0_9BACT|nr:MAG: hypothetical protein COU81_01040 [Candidatus Portnoybacteria bacterium CG10_big_fil_rev_8_21_14_0_10_36_7]